MADLHDAYNAALAFAAVKHKGQKVPGTSYPYLVHVVNVAMEILVAAGNTPDFDTQYAVTLALMHDSMEDTEASYKEIKEQFGEKVAEGVLALTKFSNLEKKYQMKDSIQRIKLLGKEVWAVKLADRITNLDAPALGWDEKKRKKYKEGAENILHELGEANQYLATRLQQKIDAYQKYVETGEK